MKRTFLFVSILALLSCSVFISCEPAKKPVVIGNEAWTVNRTLTYLTKTTLERAGYEVKVRNEDISEIFEGLGKGNIDVYMDAWENAHSVYIFKQDGIEELGTVYEDCMMGVAVPSYFEVESLSQLRADSSIYDNIFYGTERSSGVMISARTAFKNYGMNPQIVEMEEDELMAKLQLMYDKQQNFVVSAWSPHWMNQHFGLRYLIDSTESFGEKENILSYGRPNFTAERPNVAAICKRISLSNEQMSQLLLLVRGASSDEEYAQIAEDWLQENPKVLQAWIGQ